jgi:hypothetical protein
LPGWTDDDDVVDDRVGRELDDSDWDVAEADDEADDERVG